MKKFALWGTALAILVAGSAADAADMRKPRRRAPPPPPPSMFAPIPVYNWTGLYVGAHIGGAWDNVNVTGGLLGLNWGASRSGFLGGGQVGFNYQVSPMFVVGVEFDIAGTDLSTTSGIFATGVGNLQASADTNWIATLTGRFGFAFDRALLYGKFGVAWVDNSATITNFTTGNTFTASNTSTGWVIGVGLEYAFAPQWRAKVEFNHIELDGWNWNNGVFANGFTVDREINILKFGLNYAWNWAPTPLMVRY